MKIYKIAQNDLSDFEPIELRGLADEALKCSSFEEFKHNFLIQIKHGTYWHITSDPDFYIDLTKGPRDMSSLSIGDSPDKGSLMVTSDLEMWAEQYPDRHYAAEIDLSNANPADYYQVNRGFGNEFFVVDASKAKVVRVLPIEKALDINKQRHDMLPNSEDELRAFYEKVREQYQEGDELD